MQKFCIFADVLHCVTIMAIKRKIQQAIKLIQAIGREKTLVEVAYSGGKDSDIVLQLAKMSGINFTAIHKDTTVACPHTLEHVREMGASIVRPRLNFFQVIEEKGVPNRFRRFCCSELKEYKILDNCLYGIRREESARRAKRYLEPYDCRVQRGGRVNAVYPILYWTVADELEFIRYADLKLHPAYYVNGSLDLTRRVGCMGCPLRGDRGLADFRARPVLVKLWVRAIGRYLASHPDSNYIQLYGDEYGVFAKHLFFERLEDYNEFTDLNKPDWRAYLSNYFRIKL